MITAISLLLPMVKGVLSTYRVYLYGFIIAVYLTTFSAVLYYKSEYESELVKGSTVLSEYTQVSSELETCSNDIKNLSVESTKKLDAAKLATKIAKDTSRKYQNYANELLSSQPVSSDQEISSKDLFNKYLLNLKKESNK